MKFILGYVVVLGCVLGGYMMHGGFLSALWQPSEFVIIGGAAAGAFIVANPIHNMRAVGRSMPLILKGDRFNTDDYLELLGMLYMVFDKIRRSGMLAIEDDVENPDQSSIFQMFPKIQQDHHVMDFVSDYLRIMVLGNMNPHEIENLMDIELETHHHESMQPSEAVTTMSDGLPAFGIVAAVMGVVVTMGYISEPPEVLGTKVAAALVGTFLGVLLAYGFVGPLGTALKHLADEEAAYFVCIKTCFIATLQGYGPDLALEYGRKTLPSVVRPSFSQLEESLRERKAAAKQAS
jgi:chemotaxis protein MotA